MADGGRVEAFRVEKSMPAGLASAAGRPSWGWAAPLQPQSPHRTSIMQSGFIKSRVAAGAIAPWSIAAFTGNRNEVAQATGSTTGLAGITDYLGIDAVCADRMVDLQLTEVADVKAGGTIAPGDPITSDANGAAIKAVKAVGAEVFCIGIAQEPAVVGDVFGVLVSPFVITA
ncbi:hypothetical protein D3272_22990 [Lichenibacterium ramalinae]|uniref:DUF2190 family protein n=1 Tax=Lichenibacterium ramalinae TaxID=2316527 RepID=A0A4Q2R658_9HYPH|nr:hypothetical protein D3272_22990 [Lichenibacterium ramalinae]